MAEALRDPSSEKCATCPNRNRISRALAQIVGAENKAPECEGPVTVSRGWVVTQTRQYGEPEPPKGTWTSMIGSVRPDAGPMRYNRTEWLEEEQCGQEPVRPRNGEVNAHPFDGELIYTLEGKRYAAFIRGSKQQIQDYMSAQALGRIDG